MPFKSLAQEGYMHAHPEILGKKGLAEWDAATKGKSLPERKSMAHDHETAASGLAHKAPEKKMHKPQPEAHVKKLHSGGYLVTKHHGDGKPSTDHGAENLAEVSQHLEDHMGEPNDGEGEEYGE